MPENYRIVSGSFLSPADTAPLTFSLEHSIYGPTSPPCNHKGSSQNSSVITVNFPVKLIQVCDMNSFVQFSRSRTFCISLNPAKRPNIVMLQHSGKKSYVKHPDTYLCFCVIFFGSRYLIILLAISISVTHC